MKQLILGSSSRWRAQILSDAGVSFTQMEANIDEKQIRDDDPYRLTRKIALAKAAALLPRITTPSLLVTADQVVVFYGEIREKPVDATQAREWLTQYRGKSLLVVNAVIVVDTEARRTLFARDTATVKFSEYPKAVIDVLVADEESGIMQSCGGFVHEHPLMTSYARCYHRDEDETAPVSATAVGNDPDALTSVSGLPLKKTLKLLAEIGWEP